MTGEAYDIEYRAAHPYAEGAATAYELKEAHAARWAEAAAKHGSYLDVPFDVAMALGEQLRLAECARLGLDGNHKPLSTSARVAADYTPPVRTSTCALEGCDRVSALDSAFCSLTHATAHHLAASTPERRVKREGGVNTGQRCKNGHDLRSTTPDGKAVLAIQPSGSVCRLCKREAAAKHAARAAAKKAAAEEGEK